MAIARPPSAETGKRAAEESSIQTGWVWRLDRGTRQVDLAASRKLPPFLQNPIRMSGRRCLSIDRFRQDEPPATNVPVLKGSRLATIADQRFARGRPQEVIHWRAAGGAQERARGEAGRPPWRDRYSAQNGPSAK